MTFQNYPLKSISLEEAKESIDRIDEENFSNFIIVGTNICQYGFDLYQDYKLPELIEYIEKKKNIKEVEYIGFAFRDAIHSHFEIPLAKSNKKVTLSGGLESGVDRILKMMRKGYTAQEILDFVDFIRKSNDIHLVLNVISGFPTESLNDVLET